MAAGTQNLKYLKVEAETLVTHIAVLEERIAARFPGVAIGSLCNEVLQVARSSATLARRVQRPKFGIRLFNFLFILAGIGLFTYVVQVFTQQTGIVESFSFIQTLQAALALIGVPVSGHFFLRSLEERTRRREIIMELHKLHAFLNAIDLHQLTKDLSAGMLTRYELTRYLDYCSEMLALIGKIAVLFGQESDDFIVNQSVIELEQLAASYSAKIWNKILILDRAKAETAFPVPA